MIGETTKTCTVSGITPVHVLRIGIKLVREIRTTVEPLSPLRSTQLRHRVQLIFGIYQIK